MFPLEWFYAPGVVLDFDGRPDDQVSAAHQADIGYSQIERLANLGELPATGFRIACFPLRVVGASAAPARVVAMLED